MSTDEPESPRTQEAADLVPPRRRPPTAIGAATPEPPRPSPPRPWLRRRRPQTPIRFVVAAAEEYLDILHAAARRLLRPGASRRRHQLR